MAGSMEGPVLLYVEGDDDMHVITHLLKRHDLTWDLKAEVPRHPYPKVEVTEGVDELLERVKTQVKAGTGRTIGFVLDANSPIADRWEAVRDRLGRAQVDTPDEPPAAGFLGRSKRFDAKIGVWLMPDNQRDGKLEDFLSTLIDDGDSLIGHAEAATVEAKEDHGALFSEGDTIKARLHAWLAWQEEPGCPYGTAIRAKYFEHDSAVAQSFVEWFKDLYGIDT